MSAPPGTLVAVGDAAPDFEIADAAGREYRLAEFRGSPLVIAFHPAHWDPARAEHVAAYNRLIANVPGQAGARLVSITGRGAWHELTFVDGAVCLPVLTDEAGRVAQRYGVRDEPAVFVLDGAGVVRWRHVGEAPPRADDVATALAALASRDENEPHEAPAPRKVAGCPSVERSETDTTSSAWTRRDFVATALGGAFAVALAPLAARAERVIPAQPPVPPDAPLGPETVVPVRLRVNGREVALTLDTRVTLLDALREYAGLTGSKKGCDHGQCGACTVHVNGRRVLSCLTLAVMQQGQEITTVEGLASSASNAAAGEASLHPMQQAFLEHDGFQCGYCTPGQLMSATAMLREPWGASDDDVREAMSGNICRCGAYPGIVAAIQQVRGKTGAASDGTPRR